MTKPSILERIKVWLWLLFQPREETGAVGPKRKLKRKEKKEKETSMKRVRKYHRENLDTW